MVHQLDRMLEDRAHAAALLPRLGCITRGCAKLLMSLLRGGVPPSEPFVQVGLKLLSTSGSTLREQLHHTTWRS